MNKAVKDDEVVVEEEVTEEQEDQEEASEGSESTEETETEDEVTEIVLEGDDGSQPVDQNNLGIRKRINKLNAKVSDANDGRDTANTALANEQEKNTLLRLQLAQQQQPEPSKIPDPLDFDGGASDPKYVTAMNSYHQEFVRVALAEQAPKPETKTNAELVKAQTRHYEAANDLGISDYEAVEDVAVEILGKETVNQLIGQASNSPLILYHLGKNPEKAKRIAELVAANPIKGVMELGALAANLKVTKVKRNQAPNPDGVLEGAKSPSKGTRGPKGAVYS